MSSRESLRDSDLVYRAWKINYWEKYADIFGIHPLHYNWQNLQKAIQNFLTRINLYNSEQTSVIGQTRVPVLALTFWCDPVYVSIRAIRKGAYSSFTVKVKAKISP